MSEMNYLNLTVKGRDQHIYRIMSQEHVYSLFTDKKNVLSQMHNWRDKFENFQIKLGSMRDENSFKNSFKNDFVGQCWTRRSLSEAMWGIYANDPNKRYLRIRSTPRKLLTGLVDAHPEMSQHTCFVGKVEYKKEEDLKAYAKQNRRSKNSPKELANSLLLKRRAFRHESEVRLFYFDSSKKYDAEGLYCYKVDPHKMVTQIMADPNRDRKNWIADLAKIKDETGFDGEIKRSKIYDPPDWDI